VCSRLSAHPSVMALRRLDRLGKSRRSACLQAAAAIVCKDAGTVARPRHAPKRSTHHPVTLGGSGPHCLRRRPTLPARIHGQLCLATAPAENGDRARWLWLRRPSPALPHTSNGCHERLPWREGPSPASNGSCHARRRTQPAVGGESLLTP